MIVGKEKPWWYPEKCDEKYFDRLREDYPEDAHMSDEDLNEHYNEGRKYAITWDHTGDAYEEYIGLADAFLAAEALIKEIGELEHVGILKVRNLFDCNPEFCKSRWVLYSAEFMDKYTTLQAKLKEQE